MKTLGLNGAVINSHFRGHYLDEVAYWPILEALEANDAALYIHPTIPPREMVAAVRVPRLWRRARRLQPRSLDTHHGPDFSGAFDRFPKLRLVIGHMGEGLPLLLYRFDWMQSNADGRPGLRGGQPPVKLQHKVSALLQAQHLDHHQRPGLGAFGEVLHGRAGRGAGVVCHGLSVSTIRRRGGCLRCLRHQPAAQEDVDAKQRRARSSG